MGAAVCRCRPWRAGLFRLWSAVVLVTLLAACAGSAGIYHTVRDGQTLYRISKSYGVDELHLARINGVSDPKQLKVGDRIFIPGADHVVEVAAANPSTTSPARQAPMAAKSDPPSALPAAAKRKPATKSATKSANLSQQTDAPRSAVEPNIPPPAAAKTSPASSSANAPPQFAWPLRGKLLRTFGSPGTPPCKGLEIAAKPGGAILSAAAGKVIYSGDGIRSYGNLIIIRHDESFFSVYGYNERNLVTTGSFVSKGEKIALAGVPPAGGSARLYFEIRRGKEAVNPINHLP